MKRTRREMETIILMNAEESTVEVYTADPVYMRKCDKLCAIDPENWRLVKEENDSKTYVCYDKRLIGLRRHTAPSAPFSRKDTVNHGEKNA